eukprot:gene3888-9707_t
MWHQLRPAPPGLEDAYLAHRDAEDREATGWCGTGSETPYSATWSLDHAAVDAGFDPPTCFHLRDARNGLQTETEIRKVYEEQSKRMQHPDMPDEARRRPAAIMMMVG